MPRQIDFLTSAAAGSTDLLPTTYDGTRGMMVLAQPQGKVLDTNHFKKKQKKSIAQ